MCSGPFSGEWRHQRIIPLSSGWGTWHRCCQWVCVDPAVIGCICDLRSSSGITTVEGIISGIYTVWAEKGRRVWWRPCQQQARDGVTRSPLVTLTETGDVKVGQKTVSSYRRHPLDGHSEWSVTPEILKFLLRWKKNYITYSESQSCLLPFNIFAFFSGCFFFDSFALGQPPPHLPNLQRLCDVNYLRLSALINFIYRIYTSYKTPIRIYWCYDNIDNPCLFWQLSYEIAPSRLDLLMASNN